MSNSQAFDEIFETGPEDGRRNRRKKPWRVGLKIFGVLLVLALLVVAGVGGYLWYVGKSWDDGANTLPDDIIQNSEPPDQNAARNILLLGSDSRVDKIDYTTAKGFRSDTIMVMHIPADRKNVQIMSIPRDSWVSIDGHGKAKINAALSYGGLPLAVKTVSQFIGVQLDEVAIIDFEGFKSLTDSVGGVDVEATQDFSIDGHSFHKGVNHLDGDAALAFVRERKSFRDGDLQRARNQQAFLSSLMDKVISADTLKNPTKVAGMVRDFAPYMTVSKGLNASSIAGLGFQLRDIRKGDVQFFTAPIAGAGVASDGQQYLKVDEAAHAKLRDAFKSDTVAKYVESAKPVHL